jgi:hypothetical protein
VSAITSTATGAGNHTRGIYRTTELTGTIANPGALVAAGGGSSDFAATTSSPGSGSYNYYFPTTTNDAAALSIGSFVTAGLYKIEISWAANSGHSSSVNYSYDETGAGFAGSTLALSGVNQTGMSDGRAFFDTGGLPLTWSGFAELGTFTVGTNSQIWLQKGLGDTAALTMGALQFTAVPEPSTTALAIAGLVLAGSTLARRRRAAAKQ